MDYQSHSPWEHQMFPYNSMTAPQVDQQEASYSPDGPIQWLANLDPLPRGRSHPDSHQEWAHTPEPPKAFSNMQNHQQQYSYQEAHQNTYPPPQVFTPSHPYNPSSSFNTQWAPSPSIDSRDSSALSPQSDRDFRQDLSIAALPLSRSQSGFSTLSREADYFTSGGQPFQQQTILNMSMIHHQAEETPTFREDDEILMDADTGELESITVVTSGPRPTNPHFLFPHRSPAPTSIHRHVSPAPSSYSSHNPSAPRLTPNHAVVEVDDAELDAEFDHDSQPAADDTDTDGTYTPRPRRVARVRRNRRVQPATPLHPSTTTRVTKRGPKASTSSAGRASTSNPTFPCTFAWAGCTSAFASKNEWKRHVASKHTCFHYWECHVGSCSGPGQSGKFNRKDLFAQHLRRMHSPGASAKSGPGKEEWERKLAALQDDGKRKGRAMIKKVACPVPGCREAWDGTRAWDERMEHVARHWEAVARGEDATEWFESAGGVLEWAEQEGAVKMQGGRWVLGGPVGEADAVGEEE